MEHSYEIRGKLSLANNYQGDVPFLLYVAQDKVPEHPVLSDFTRLVEKLTGHFVAEINFDLIANEDLIG